MPHDKLDASLKRTIDATKASQKPRCVYCNHPVKTRVDVDLVSTVSPSAFFGLDLQVLVRCQKCGNLQSFREMQLRGKKKK